MRGHRLVADDIVEVTRRKQDTVYGVGQPDHQAPHGDPRPRASSTSRTSSAWPRSATARRSSWSSSWSSGTPSGSTTGWASRSASSTSSAWTSRSPRIPVRPGRNITTLIEVAARNHLLKLQGHHSRQGVRRAAQPRHRRGRHAEDAGRGGRVMASRRTVAGASSSSPACRARGSPPRSGRSRTPATSASTTFRWSSCRSSPSWPSWPAGTPAWRW